MSVITSSCVGPRQNGRFVAVREAQQLGPELVPAPDSCQSSAGCTIGITELDRARAIHLLADDGIDLAQHAQPHRQPV
jgi:hypothetical protein